ncbi:hypothetical protein M1466_01580 [Candidatus Dependentiae bacterium]|nr:hypothetical protein [Candidatus Dependentiae bacterium]
MKKVLLLLTLSAVLQAQQDFAPALQQSLLADNAAAIITEQSSTSRHSPAAVWGKIREAIATAYNRHYYQNVSGYAGFPALMLALGSYWGTQYATILNSTAMILGGYHTTQVARQHPCLQLIALGTPMLALYLMNIYFFDTLNPYPGNEFFLALCGMMMHELTLLAGRMPTTARTIYTIIQDKIPQAVLQTAETTFLMGSATAIGIGTESMQEEVPGSYTFLTTLYTANAAGNVADMFKKQAYWLRSLVLLPATAAAGAVNYFACDNKRPEISYLFFFAWLSSSIDQIKQLLAAATATRKDHAYNTASDALS